MRDYTIRRFNYQDIPSFMRLWKIHFGEKEAIHRKNLVDWILKGNPFSTTHNDYFVAQNRERIIAYHGSMPFRFVISGFDIDATIHFDALIDPILRGQGILGLLLDEMAKCDRPFTIALWFNRSSSRVYERYGWRPVKNINHYVRIYDSTHYIKRKISRMPTILIKVVNSFLKRIYKIETFFFIKEQRGLTIQEIVSFDERFDQFFHEIKKSFHCISYRTHDVLNWRYADKPGAPYRRWICFEEGILKGYFVFQTKRQSDGSVVATIHDFLCSPERSDIFKALLNKVIREIEKESPRYIEILSSHRAFSSLLKKHLFISTGENNLALKIKNDCPMDGSYKILDGKNWFFTYGDGDWGCWSS